MDEQTKLKADCHESRFAEGSKVRLSFHPHKQELIAISEATDDASEIAISSCLFLDRESPLIYQQCNARDNEH